MGAKPFGFSISPDASPFVALNQWVNPHRHRNPEKFENSGGAGDVGFKLTTPLTYNPRKLKVGHDISDGDSKLTPPTIYKVFLRGDPLVPTAKRLRYFTVDEIAEEKDDPWPFKPVSDISRWRNIRRPLTAAKENSSPLKTMIDLLRGRHLRSPLTAMKSPSNELAGNVGVNPPGDGLAGRAEEMGSPAQIEVELLVEGEESTLNVSPLSSLVIPSCDKEMWDKAVADAELWVKEMFPWYDRR